MLYYPDPLGILIFCSWFRLLIRDDSDETAATCMLGLMFLLICESDVSLLQVSV